MTSLGSSGANVVCGMKNYAVLGGDGANNEDVSGK